MKETKELKTNRGITLISLIITIIIMLILAGVTIEMVVNQDLFGYAKNAVGDTQNALDYEQQLANDLVDEWIKPNIPSTPELQGTWIFNDDIDECLGTFEFTVNLTTTYTDGSVKEWVKIRYTNPTGDPDFWYYAESGESVNVYVGWGTWLADFANPKAITITDTYEECADAAELYAFLTANATKQN